MTERNKICKYTNECTYDTSCCTGCPFKGDKKKHPATVARLKRYTDEGDDF
jgi:hypothetical protein